LQNVLQDGIDAPRFGRTGRLTMIAGSFIVFGTARARTLAAPHFD